MTIYSSTFVKSSSAGEEFARVCQTVEEVMTAWRNAVPARRRLGYQVTCYDKAPWFRIDGTLQSESEQLLSEKLSTDVLGIYASDEIVLQFLLNLFGSGRLIRSLIQSEVADELVWTGVDGQPQSWESSVFFSGAEMPRYAQFAKDDGQRETRTRVLAGRQIVQGADVPWAADYHCIVRLSRALRLPWMNEQLAPARTYQLAPLEATAKRPWWLRAFLGRQS
jgi:hypothetical protein